MRQKNNSSQQITKTDLELALKKYATKEDIKTEIKTSADEILIKVDENARKYKDEILAKMDEVMGELGTMRDENTIGSGQTSQLPTTTIKELNTLKRSNRHLDNLIPIA